MKVILIKQQNESYLFHFDHFYIWNMGKQWPKSNAVYGSALKPKNLEFILATCKIVRYTFGSSAKDLISNRAK